MTSIGDIRKFIPFARKPAVRDLLKRNGKLKNRYLLPAVRYFGHFEFFSRSMINNWLQRHDGPHAWRPKPLSKEVFAANVERRRKMTFRYDYVPEHRERFLAQIREYPHRQFVIVMSPPHPTFVRPHETNWPTSESSWT